MIFKSLKYRQNFIFYLVGSQKEKLKLQISIPRSKNDESIILCKMQLLFRLHKLFLKTGRSYCFKFDAVHVMSKSQIVCALNRIDQNHEYELSKMRTS